MADPSVPPCICGAHIGVLPASVSHCHIHHVNEVIPPGAYQVCFECGHVYPTAQSLVDAFNREADREHEHLTVEQVDRIFFCQECIHDF